ncbi:MAG: hypothetical protein KJO79_02850 [Verrucomicrobiae bacterium]|nr:hypothetical protein [Verrucomicrobiae bacterium]NNJ86094.1 hypothetical protein [Akkermansiaceae bacterium]
MIPSENNCLTITLCVSLLMGSFGSAQETAGGETEEKKYALSPTAAHMSIVALGPIPSRRYKMPDGSDLEDIESGASDTVKPDTKEDSGKARKGGAGIEGSGNSGAADIPLLLDPVEGTIPPPALFYETPKAKNRNSWSRLRVGFNNATAVGPVPAGIPLALYSTNRKARTNYKKFLTLSPLKPATQVILFLTPQGTAKRPWSKPPQVSVLNIRSMELADKNVLVRNFADYPVAFKLNDNDPVVLAPKQRKSFTLDKKHSFNRVLAMDVSTRKPIIKTGVRLRNNTLNILAFYNANAKTNGGKKIGVFHTAVDRLTATQLNKPIVQARN